MRTELSLGGFVSETSKGGTFDEADQPIMTWSTKEFSDSLDEKIFTNYNSIGNFIFKTTTTIKRFKKT